MYSTDLILLSIFQRKEEQGHFALVEDIINIAILTKLQNKYQKNKNFEPQRQLYTLIIGVLTRNNIKHDMQSQTRNLNYILVDHLLQFWIVK